MDKRWRHDRQRRRQRLLLHLRRQQRPSPMEIIPTELIIQIFTHMDEKTAKAFSLTSKRINSVWQENRRCIFIGMHHTQFRDYTGLFGYPWKRSILQKAMLDLAESFLIGTPPPPKPDTGRLVGPIDEPDSTAQEGTDEVALWWSHFRNIRYFRDNRIADDLFHLCYLPGGKRFDTSLTVKAIILDYGMSTAIGYLAKLSGREVEQLLRMFGEQSVAVRARFLEIVCFLGNKILPRESLTPYAAQLALPDEQGGITEPWLLLRILAWSLHAVLFCSLSGCHDIWCFDNADESEFEGWGDDDFDRWESGQAELKEDLLSLLNDDESSYAAGRDEYTFVQIAMIFCRHLWIADPHTQTRRGPEFWKESWKDEDLI